MITYYFQLGPYPTINSRISGNAATNAAHLTLEGAIQNYIDGIHVLLANTQGQDLSEDPGAASQLDQGAVAQNIDALSKFWPRFYLDSVTPGKTAQGIADQYKQDIAPLFSAYGR